MILNCIETVDFITILKKLLKNVIYLKYNRNFTKNINFEIQFLNLTSNFIIISFII